jgi:hypothetical protein
MGFTAHARMLRGLAAARIARDETQMYGVDVSARGWGQTEKLEELTRIDQRISNTIAVLKRRQKAVERLWRMELNRWRREQDAGGAA